MEAIQTRREISSYILGAPSALAIKRRCGLPRINTLRGISQNPFKDKILVGKSPTSECIEDDFSPRSSKCYDTKMTYLPFIYAQSHSGRGTPVKELNLPLSRREPEIILVNANEKEVFRLPNRRFTFAN
ncbi:hypothetical protein SteCoe_15219 [Stentor coeruleus]|uniref:Uncharacterized protein n=1 Tax=Stentor coeruleus TaxID=5963 RepID=A0A1R2C4A9_9CILI|nr:hypothetical protein SteCoe_15219 [Stentor coeruleus]